MKRLPRILVIDDVLGNTCGGTNEDRMDFCQRLGLKDVTGDASAEPIADPLAEATFTSAQRPDDKTPKNSVEKALDAVANGWPNSDGTRWALVLLDRSFSRERDDFFGFEILKSLVTKWPDPEERAGNCQIPIIMLSGLTFAEGGSAANPHGAHDYIEKHELDRPKLVWALNKYGLIEDADGILVGRSYQWLKTLRSARVVGLRGQGNVLLLGGTGVGKSFLVPYLCNKSPRADHPIVTQMGGGQADPAILRSQLFGFWARAFGQANISQPGSAEKAHHGTLFIDEIANLDAQGQAELLLFANHEAQGTVRRVQRMGTFPIGPDREVQQANRSVVGELDNTSHLITVDVFLIAATNESLDYPEVRKRIPFREDLYYRLADSVIHVPSLADRKEDILPLFRFFLGLASARLNGTWPKRIDSAVEQALASHEWPGNVRELEKFSNRVAENTVPWDEIHMRNLPTLSAGAGTVRAHELRDDDGYEVSDTAGTPSPSFANLISDMESLRFDSMPIDELEGMLPSLQNAYARLIGAYLRAALEITRKRPSRQMQIVTAAKLITGDGELSGSKAADLIKRLLAIDPTFKEEILKDPVLADAHTIARKLRPTSQKSRSSAPND